MTAALPETCQPVDRQTEFRFACHPGVACFTECCRELNLVLSPYDVLRLKNRLRMSSGDFLEQHVIVDREEGHLFPQCYLTMVDDGRASCVFVNSSGCSVYEDRPGACRAYPVGRGVSLEPQGQINEHLLLVQEQHCLGFAEHSVQTPEMYLADQGLEIYSRFNDPVLTVTRHQQIQEGFQPTPAQQELYLLALYNLDGFRQEWLHGRFLPKPTMNKDELQGLAGDDEQLLLFAIRWLRQEFFEE